MWITWFYIIAKNHHIHSCKSGVSSEKSIGPTSFHLFGNFHDIIQNNWHKLEAIETFKELQGSQI